MLAQVAQEVSQVEPDFSIDLNWLNLVAGAIIPLLVGIVTRWEASSRLKALANLTLSAVGGYVTHLIANQGAFTVKEFVSAFLLVWVSSLATYEGFWKPSGAAPAVQKATSSFGLR